MKYGFGWLMAGMIFLFQPMVNVIDILPDVIGWMCIGIGLAKLSCLREELAQARRYAWILAGITAARLLPMYWSLSGAKAYPLAAEPTMVLTYAFVFGLTEAVMVPMTLNTVIRNLSGIGLRGDSKAALRGVGSLKGLTWAFFIIRSACSILPELVYLRSTEYLDYIIYGVVIDIREYRPYLVILFSLIAAVVGIVWLIRTENFLRRIQKDSAFCAYTDRLLEEHRQEVRFRTVMDRVCAVLVLVFLGGIFFCELSAEHVDILPDAIGVLFWLTALLLARKLVPVPRKLYGLTVFSLIALIPYYVLTVRHEVQNHFFWTADIVQYFTRQELAVSPERQSAMMQTQLVILLAALLETALLILLAVKVFSYLKTFRSLSDEDSLTLYDTMNETREQFEKEKAEKLPKRCFGWFAASAAMEAVGSLPVFAFTVTPIALIRMVINGIFLCVLYQYLSYIHQVVVYHFHYNHEETAHFDA